MTGGREKAPAEDFLLRTRRLTMRPVALSDAPDLFRHYTAEIARYQYPAPYADLSAAREMVRSLEQMRRNGEAADFVLLSSETGFLGEACIFGLKGDFPEIGVWIRRDCWRQGFAGEALTALLRRFAPAGYPAFRYEADCRNAASLSLAKRLGGILTGEDSYENQAGNLLEMQVYRIPAEPYLPKNLDGKEGIRKAEAAK